MWSSRNTLLQVNFICAFGFFWSKYKHFNLTSKGNILWILSFNKLSYLLVQFYSLIYTIIGNFENNNNNNDKCTTNQVCKALLRNREVALTQKIVLKVVILSNKEFKVNLNGYRISKYITMAQRQYM